MCLFSQIEKYFSFAHHNESGNDGGENCSRVICSAAFLQKVSKLKGTKKNALLFPVGLAVAHL